MKIVRFYTGQDNETHFGEVDINTEKTGNSLNAELIKVKGIFFRDTPPAAGSQFIPFHPVSRRQFGVILKGEMEIQVGDGSTKRFAPGDIFLAEDTTGHGHRTRAVSGGVLDILFIPLE
jgi:hypothetical protein